MTTTQKTRKPERLRGGCCCVRYFSVVFKLNSNDLYRTPAVVVAFVAVEPEGGDNNVVRVSALHYSKNVNTYRPKVTTYMSCDPCSVT
jgi:hypothetical protein